MARKRMVLTACAAALAALAPAQVPDLLNALDAGGRAMGIGGATDATDSNTLSTYYNPAGLAYITGPTISVAFRNMPQSDSIITGDFNNPTFDTSREVGARRMSHLGYATPISGGVFGVSFTTGGYLKDFRSQGASLKDGVLNLNAYNEVFTAQSDFFTVAWGKRSGNSNFGIGLVIANQYISDIGSYNLVDANNNLVGSTQINNSGNMTGIGGIIGVQIPTSKDGRSMMGISVRSPISLKNNSVISNYLNKIPGRASIGLASRTDSLRDGADFIVYGAQLDYYFGADKGGFFKRKDVVAGGVGFEYNMHRSGARIPLRAGYQFVPEGGENFQHRNTFTFGLGYRPDNSNLAVDLNFGLPTGGGPYDMGLSMTYKLGH